MDLDSTLQPLHILYICDKNLLKYKKKGVSPYDNNNNVLYSPSRFSTVPISLNVFLGDIEEKHCIFVVVKVGSV